MVRRCGFVGDILYSIGVTGFIAPIVGHWAWGPDGWLATMTTPFRDFAGSTVVHSIGGAISLMGAIALGPRLGRIFRRDGGGPPLPHNIILGAVGGLILWFGWYGFNPGSTLSALDMQGIARVSFNTTMAACTGGLRPCSMPSPAQGWDLGMTTNGFLAGSWLSPARAIGSARRARFHRDRRGLVVVWATDVSICAHRRPDRAVPSISRAASGERSRSASSPPVNMACRRRPESTQPCR
jgi:hypothetical protein